MPPSAWKGSISFGLISIPIRLYPAARHSHVAFHEIHRECGNRVRQQLYCPFDKRVVSRDEIAMGYEVDKDQYVLIDPTEIKKLQPPSSTSMEILQFVKLTEVDPIYFETSYFSVPEEVSARAYALLLDTMNRLKYAALAKLSLHQREKTVIIRPYKNGLTVHTIYYPNEIHQVKEYGIEKTKTFNKAEIQLADQLAKSLLKPFRPDQFHDAYQEMVMQLVESQQKGRP